MLFGVRASIARKIKDLLKVVVRDSDKLSWKDELIAAKTIETYIKILNEEINI